MTKAKPSFYAVIPANVRYDKSLTDGAKLLFGEITALCSDKGYCWATNSYFAGLYGVSNTTISTWVSRLEKAGHIKRVIKYKEGSKEIEGRYLSILNGGMQENLNTPIQENLKESTTSLSTTSINTSNTDSRELELFNYYLSKDIVQHQKFTSFMRSKAKTALREHSIEDLKEVIDNYVAVVESDDHFFNTKYTFVDILRPKDITQFSTEANPFEKFKSFDNKKGGIDSGKTDYVDDVGVHGVKLYK